jgi:hypothetical protein
MNLPYRQKAVVTCDCGAVFDHEFVFGQTDFKCTCFECAARYVFQKHPTGVWKCTGSILGAGGQKAQAEMLKQRELGKRLAFRCLNCHTADSIPDKGTYQTKRCRSCRREIEFQKLGDQWNQHVWCRPGSWQEKAPSTTPVTAPPIALKTSPKAPVRRIGSVNDQAKQLLDQKANDKRLELALTELDARVRRRDQESLRSRQLEEHTTVTKCGYRSELGRAWEGLRHQYMDDRMLAPGRAKLVTTRKAFSTLQRDYYGTPQMAGLV